MRGFLRLAVFVIVGPIVCLVATPLAYGTYTLAATGSLQSFAFTPALPDLATLINVYAWTLLPCLLNGIAAIFIAWRVKGLPCWLWTALVGVVTASPIAALLVVETAPSVQWTAMAIFVSIGGIVAFVCAALFDALASLVRKRNRV